MCALFSPEIVQAGAVKGLTPLCADSVRALGFILFQCP